MPRCSRSLRSQQHRERPSKGKRSQRCIFWAGFKDELYRCLPMEDLRSRSQRRAHPPYSLPGDVRVERREGPRRTRETRPRGGKMGVETAARTVMVERADISEAKLTETQDHLLVEEAINGSAAAFASCSTDMSAGSCVSPGGCCGTTRTLKMQRNRLSSMHMFT